MTTDTRATDTLSIDTTDFEVVGTNAEAPFTLKLHRGEGMVLLAMNWKAGQPPDNFVGFAIEYHEPGETTFFPIPNRLSFPGAPAKPSYSSREAPIQKFRWIHLPVHAELPGAFSYRVTPIFMDAQDVLSDGKAQTADVVLARDTYPDLNVAFTRGFVSSQAFVDHYAKDGPIDELLPVSAADSLTFKPTHPDETAALEWMGFEARTAILAVLDEAIADPTAKVSVIAFDLNEPEVVDRLEQLGNRLTLIIDNSRDHVKSGAPENQAEIRLKQSAGDDHVKRQHMGSLQHNKTIIVSGPVERVVCGSTNFSWRGFFVQNNNAVILTGKNSVGVFQAAFDQYWESDKPDDFGASAPASWTSLGLTDVTAQVAFSPHSADNALLSSIAADIENNTTSSLFYALAFLYESPGVLEQAIAAVTSSDRFVYGMSDKPVKGLEVQKPDGNPAPVSPGALGKNVPPPFKSEPSESDGVRLHHKFVVIDFDKPTARVYLGSYNFSAAADTKNGENLLLITDRRIAVSYVVEAVRLFDHFEFRSKQDSAATAQTQLALQKPPRSPDEVPWFSKDYTQPRKARDRLLFA
jgi:hypothetical protein